MSLEDLRSKKEKLEKELREVVKEINVLEHEIEKRTGVHPRCTGEGYCHFHGVVHYEY